MRTFLVLVLLCSLPVLAVDTDSDGILDNDDRCPRIAGIASLSGCPDCSFSEAGIGNVERDITQNQNLDNSDGHSDIFPIFPQDSYSEYTRRFCLAFRDLGNEKYATRAATQLKIIDEVGKVTAMSFGTIEGLENFALDRRQEAAAYFNTLFDSTRARDLEIQTRGSAILAQIAPLFQRDMKYFTFTSDFTHPYKQVFGNQGTLINQYENYPFEISLWFGNHEVVTFDCPDPAFGADSFRCRFQSGGNH